MLHEPASAELCDHSAQNRKHFPQIDTNLKMPTECECILFFSVVFNLIWNCSNTFKGRIDLHIEILPSLSKMMLTIYKQCWYWHLLLIMWNSPGCVRWSSDRKLVRQPNLLPRSSIRRRCLRSPAHFRCCRSWRNLPLPTMARDYDA
jgi:hypothetical protein